MPKRGAITRARQLAPLRNAPGPSFFRIFLQWQGECSVSMCVINTGPDEGNACVWSSILPDTVHYSIVGFLISAFFQGLQPRLYHWTEHTSLRLVTRNNLKMILVFSSCAAVMVAHHHKGWQPQQQHIQPSSQTWRTNRKAQICPLMTAGRAYEGVQKGGSISLRMGCP